MLRIKQIKNSLEGKMRQYHIDGGSLSHFLYDLRTLHLSLLHLLILLIGESRKCSCHFLLSFCTAVAYVHWLNVESNRMQSMVIDFRPLFLSADVVNCCK